jgi:hypothetical protein
MEILGKFWRSKSQPLDAFSCTDCVYVVSFLIRLVDQWGFRSPSRPQWTCACYRELRGIRLIRSGPKSVSGAGPTWPLLRSQLYPDRGFGRLGQQETPSDTAAEDGT